MLCERAEVWSPAADERGVEIEVLDGDDLDEIIEFDPNDLEQVLDNLLANAIDAAPSGSVIELWVEEVPRTRRST